MVTMTEESLVAAMTAPEVITAPPITPPPTGLIQASPVVIDHEQNNGPGYRWGGTVEWVTEPCSDAVTFDPCSTTSLVTMTYADGVSTVGSTTYTSATAAFHASDVGKTVSSAATANATYADGNVTIGTATLTSATANFTPEDVGKSVTGGTINGGTTIAAYVNATTVTLSVNQTLGTTNGSFTIVARKVIQTGTTIAALTNATTVTLSAPAQATGTAGAFTIVGREPARNRKPKGAYVPFGVDAYDVCSAFGFETADYEGRARRALAARESKAVEKELWTGALASAIGATGNARLQAGGSVTRPDGTVDSLRLALAILVQAIADGNGGQGMIHMRPFLAELLLGLQLIDNLGTAGQPRLYTKTGNIVVAGSGYPGTGPAGEAVTTTSEWMFATDVVVIHRGPVEVFAPGVNGATVDHRANEVIVRAQRLYAPIFNGCVLAAVNVNPAVTGA